TETTPPPLCDAGEVRSNLPERYRGALDQVLTRVVAPASLLATLNAMNSGLDPPLHVGRDRPRTARLGRQWQARAVQRAAVTALRGRSARAVAAQATSRGAASGCGASVRGCVAVLEVHTGRVHARHKREAVGSAAECAAGGASRRRLEGVGERGRDRAAHAPQAVH